MLKITSASWCLTLVDSLFESLLVTWEVEDKMLSRDEEPCSQTPADSAANTRT